MRRQKVDAWLSENVMPVGMGFHFWHGGNALELESGDGCLYSRTY